MHRIINRLKRVEQRAFPRDMVEIIKIQHGEDEDEAIKAHCERRGIERESVGLWVIVHKFYDRSPEH